MRVFLFGIFLANSVSQALVISPTAKEVKFSYTAEFYTRSEEPTDILLEKHARFLFGYMQNPQQAKIWTLNKQMFGIGAPKWLPIFKVVKEDSRGHLRTIRYRAQGDFLLAKSVADTLLEKNAWEVWMPRNLDQYYDVNCVDPEFPQKDGFWYFYDPFQKGCEHLRESPLARDVKVKLSPIEAPEDLPANLDELRLKKDGEVFQIATINGFDKGPKKRNDDGRVNFNKMNKWFRDLGFEETVILRFKDRPVHQFDKIFKRQDGRKIHIRLLRLLANTDLDKKKRVTFAKFLQQAANESDVVIYEGHSGAGASLDPKLIEERSGMEFNVDPNRRQIFFFDACSSYSYYMSLFNGKKNPGKLNLLTNGIASLFGYEIPETKHLYKILFDVNRDYTWLEIMNNMEVPFRGTSFLLNVYINE